MRILEKVKKFAAITLAGAMVLVSANVFSVHAQSISDVSVSKPGFGTTYTQSGSGVNVRNAPNLESSTIVVSIPSGKSLMIVGESGNFYKVQYDTAGHFGYVLKDYVKFESRLFYLQANTNGSSLNMRTQTSTSATIVTKIPNGTYFAYSYLVDEWFYGVYGNAEGWTAAEYTLCLSY